MLFLGMMVGGWLWGNLADRLGRKRMLILALLVNAVFSGLSSFVTSYWLFLLCRLVSGLGYAENHQAAAAARRQAGFGAACRGLCYPVSNPHGAAAASTRVGSAGWVGPFPSFSRIFASSFPTRTAARS